MKGRIQKLGKSFVFRIPQSVADELQWKDGTLVQANIQDRKLIIEAIAVPDYDLEYLLKNMTPEHFQVDIDTGLPVGNEVW